MSNRIVFNDGRPLKFEDHRPVSDLPAYVSLPTGTLDEKADAYFELADYVRNPVFKDIFTLIGMAIKQNDAYSLHHYTAKLGDLLDADDLTTSPDQMQSFSIYGAARKIGVHPSTIYHHVRKGTLVSFRNGFGRLRVIRQSLMEYKKSREG